MNISLPLKAGRKIAESMTRKSWAIATFAPTKNKK
jgi:hypothetical protein